MQKFLLHACCCPCGIAVFEELKQQFQVTAYFYNPNIHPKEEYEKRKGEIAKLCKELNIPFAEEKYEPGEWFKWAEDYKDEPEGGQRCGLCFKTRLEKTAQYAGKNGFDYFGSTLTSGRNKKAEIINPLGIELGKKYGVKFYEEDWKKKGRQEKGACLCREKRIYKQSYCGCVYSCNL